MQHLVATKDFPYAGKPLKPGDSFEASDNDAMILKGVGKAKDAPVSAAPPAASVPVETRAVTADDSNNLFDPKQGEVQGKTKRQYKRRDMRAEG